MRRALDLRTPGEGMNATADTVRLHSALLDVGCDAQICSAPSQDYDAKRQNDNRKGCVAKSCSSPAQKKRDPKFHNDTYAIVGGGDRIPQDGVEFDVEPETASKMMRWSDAWSSFGRASWRR